MKYSDYLIFWIDFQVEGVLQALGTIALVPLLPRNNYLLRFVISIFNFLYPFSYYETSNYELTLIFGWITVFGIIT